MTNPIISIIVPTYNRANVIHVALNSVLSQTYLQWECLVIDDGSTDNTLKVLENYHSQDSRIRYFKRDREPKGAPTCRNIGLKHAKGDYIIFLDSDDYLLPFCLKQRVQTINENTDCDFSVFPMGKQKEDTIVKVEIPKHDDYLIPFLSANLPWSIMCPIWKKSFLDNLQGFTEGYPRFNDPELMVRALIEPQVKFQVFLDADYDTVYVPSLKEPNIFADKVYQSLMLFIPEIVGHLELQKKADLKKHLALYLHLWFKYIITPLESNNMKISLKLIVMFTNKGIISWSKSESLKLRLFLYTVTKYLLKNPLNKLTERALYIYK